MLAVILSPGPSLGGFDPSTQRDITIGVNAAAAAHPCDWWSAGDAQTIRRHAIERRDLIGRPKVLTVGGMAEEFSREQPEAVRWFDWLHWETLRDSLSLPHEVLNFSCPMAVALAVHLGATRVEAYGVDMSGNVDFTGAKHARFNEARWVRERSDWAMVCQIASRRGVEVVTMREAAACR